MDPSTSQLEVISQQLPSAQSLADKAAGFFQALLALREASAALGAASLEHSAVFTNMFDPDAECAGTACLRLSGLMDSFSKSLADCALSFDSGVREPCERIPRIIEACKRYAEAKVKEPEKEKWREEFKSIHEKAGRKTAEFGWTEEVYSKLDVEAVSQAAETEAAVTCSQVFTEVFDTLGTMFKEGSSVLDDYIRHKNALSDYLEELDATEEGKVKIVSKKPGGKRKRKGSLSRRESSGSMSPSSYQADSDISSDSSSTKGTSPVIGFTSAAPSSSPNGSRRPSKSKSFLTKVNMASPVAESDTDEDEEDEDEENLDEAMKRNYQETIEDISLSETSCSLLLVALVSILRELQKTLGAVKAKEGAKAAGEFAKLTSALEKVCSAHTLFDKSLVEAQEDGLNASAFAKIIEDSIYSFEPSYLHYTELVAYASDFISKNIKSRLLRSAVKMYEAQVLQRGLSNLPFDEVLFSQCSYPEKLAIMFRSLILNTPSESAGWEPLQIAKEHFNVFCDALDEAKSDALRARSLYKLMDRLPDETNLVTFTRTYIREGNLTCTASFAPLNSVQDMGGSSPSASASKTRSFRSGSFINSVSSSSSTFNQSGSTSSLTDSSPMSPPSLPGQIASGASESFVLPTLGVVYTTFLFNDCVLLCVPKKKGSPERGYKCVVRFNTRDLTFSGIVKSNPLAFRISSPQGTVELCAVTTEEYNFWRESFDKAITKRNQTLVFGTPLQELFDRQKASHPNNPKFEYYVPEFLQDAFSYIEAHGTDTEGIFRLSVNIRDLELAKRAIDSGQSVRYTDPLCAAAVVKTWLRELPEPLLLRDLYSEWTDSYDNPEKLRACVFKLPEPNRIVLTALVRHLARLAQHHQQTKMTVNNLAIVIAPNILTRRTDAPDTSSRPVDAVDSLITDCDTIFRGMNLSTSPTSNAIRAHRYAASSTSASIVPAPDAAEAEASRKRRETLRHRAKLAAVNGAASVRKRHVANKQPRIQSLFIPAGGGSGSRGSDGAGEVGDVAVALAALLSATGASGDTGDAGKTGDIGDIGDIGDLEVPAESTMKEKGEVVTVASATDKGTSASHNRMDSLDELEKLIMTNGGIRRTSSDLQKEEVPELPELPDGATSGEIRKKVRTKSNAKKTKHAKKNKDGTGSLEKSSE